MFQKGEFCLVSEGFMVGKAVITPKDAALIIEKTDKLGKQRPSSESRVARYAEDMKTGKFNGMLSNDLIQLTSNMEAVNGLHRLKAIMKSNIPLTAYVAKNIPWEAFAVADRNKTRSTADDVACDGGNGLIVPIVRHLNNIMTAGGTGNRNPDVNEVRPYLVKFQSNLDWALGLSLKYKGSQKAKDLNSLLKAEVKAAFVLAHSKFPKEVEIFVDHYITGNGFIDGFGPKLLQQYILLGGQRGVAKSKNWEICFKTLKAIKLFINNDLSNNDLRLYDTAAYRSTLREFFL